MNVVRQDAWSADDDLILAEVTLRHIREGSTQLAAFEEVGQRIGRTAAACGFRWNSFVRKNYEASIQIAKAQRQKRAKNRKELKEGNNVSTGNVTGITNQDVMTAQGQDESMSMDMVIRWLKTWKGNYQEARKQLKVYQKQLQEKEEELEKLRKENEQLRSEKDSVELDYRTVNDDYKTLIQIMERARKLTALAEDDSEHRARFKMDANGNLERVE